MSVTLKHFYKFDPFILDVEERVLLRNGCPVAVTPKVFDTLLLLVQNQGCVVSKQKILDTLWPDVFVEESNVTFNITMLRKALGDTKRKPLYIETVPRRGYRFKTDVREVMAESIRADAPENGVKSNFGNDRSRPIEAETSNRLQPAVDTPKNGTPHREPQNPDYPAVVPQVSTLYSGRKLTKSQLLAFASVLVLLIMGLAIWYLNHSNFGREQKGAHAQMPLKAVALKFEQITNSGNVVSAAISPDGKQVAFALENSGQQSLWLKQLATSVDVQIIPPAYSVYQTISFSHDGEYIYFVRHVEAQADDIYRIPALGGPSTKLIPNIGGSFSLSADDRQVAFSRVDRNKREDVLYIANIDDSNERQLAVYKEPDWLKTFAWSPDGKVMVCALGETGSSRQTITIVKIDIENEQEQLLAKPNWFNVRQFHWLPDGSGLLLCVKEKLSDPDQIWQMSYPGAEFRRVTDDLNNYLLFSLTADASKMIGVQAELSSYIWSSPRPDGNDAKIVAAGRGRVTWTPDGKIVYVSRSGVGWDVWLANADGTEARQLNFNSGNNDYPAISPDGRYVVFHSDRTGADHLWRMNSDGSNQVQLTNGYAERNATISPDGRWVYYNTAIDLKLWKGSIDGGEPVKVIDQYALYPALSPDGKLIAYYRLSNAPHKYSITVGRLEDMKTVIEIILAPGSWMSARLHWDAASTSVTYAVEHEGKVKLYEQSLSGGPPRPVASFKAEDEFDFAWSPDRSKLAYMSSKWHHDIVLISGFEMRERL
jgi:Tol biopolymer transport system component/DNA-binding winged helix-turn-helix (wHTH) protein